MVIEIVNRKRIKMFLSYFLQAWVPNSQHLIYGALGRGHSASSDIRRLEVYKEKRNHISKIKEGLQLSLGGPTRQIQWHHCTAL